LTLHICDILNFLRFFSVNSGRDVPSFVVTISVIHLMYVIQIIAHGLVEVSLKTVFTLFFFLFLFKRNCNTENAYYVISELSKLCKSMELVSWSYYVFVLPSVCVTVPVFIIIILRITR